MGIARILLTKGLPSLLMQILSPVLRRMGLDSFRQAKKSYEEHNWSTTF